MRTLSSLFIITCLFTTLRAQSPESPLFRSEANLVVLHVNVFDKRFDPVTDLTRDHFSVTEDGHLQTISFFSREDVPVAVGLVIDNSSSMIPRRRLVVAGGMAFVTSSRPDDELFVVSFTEHVRMALPAGTDFTSRRSVLQASLNLLRPGGSTALYDAVIRGLDHLERARHQKRVLIVLSDGEDTASEHSRKDMNERARESDAIIYTITATAGDHSGKPDVLRELAHIGGGVAYVPDTEDEVIRDFQVVARNIRQGYSLGYVPSNPAQGSFRHVKIVARLAGKAPFEVRYRHGYAVPGAADPQSH
jgi:VWFA-related protein